MTYDPIDTNNDGVVDADVDSQTVDANSINTGSATVNEKLDATGLTQGSPSSPVQYLRHGGAASATSQSTINTDVTGDNTAQNLIDLGVFGGMNSGFLLITGRDQNSATGFSEIVPVAVFVTGSAGLTTVRGSPGARTYGESGTVVEIAIDDAGVTYDVNVTFIGGAD